MVDRQVIQQQIISLLPADGSPVLNRAMMALIGRRLSVHVDIETYFAALDALAASDVIVRQRGQGGKIARLEPLPQPTNAEGIAWTEPTLMPSLGRYLKTLFWRGLNLPPASFWKVVDTSMHGPQEKWGRPDFTVVSIVPLKVLGAPQVDVYSFELKAEPAADLTSVHQTLAQTRMTNYGYLVWHLPEASPHEARLPTVADQCRRHGIGLILTRDPELVETWSIEVDATRQVTDLSDIDDFLTARLTAADRNEIRQRLSGT